MKHDGMFRITTIVLVLVATFANAAPTPYCRDAESDAIQEGNHDPTYGQAECVLRL